MYAKPVRVKYKKSNIGDILNEERLINDRGDINSNAISSFKWNYLNTEHGVLRADEAISKYGYEIKKPDRKQLATDAINTPIGNPKNVIGRINSLALNNFFLGWGELSLLQQNAVVHNICEVLSSTATHNWITITSDGDDKDKVKILEEECKKYDLQKLTFEAMYKTFLMGTCYISPKFKDDDDYLKYPIVMDSSQIEKDSLEYFTTIEPTWVVPLAFNMSNPRSKDFYKPQEFNVMGQYLDATRLYQLKHIQPADLISPMYLFGGIPLIQIVLPAILDFQAAKKEVITLLTRMKATILKTNVNNLKGSTDSYGSTTTLSGNLKSRVALYERGLNNTAIGVLAQDEEFEQLRFSMAELKDILQQQAEFISLMTRIPVTKLFGQSPGGMNATGEYDAANFHESISTTQEKDIRPMLKYMLDILQVNTFGVVDKSINFVFNPLDEVGKIELSSLKNDVVDRAVKMITANQNGEFLFSPEDIRDYLMNDEELALEIENGNSV